MLQLPGYSIIIFAIVLALVWAEIDHRVLKKKYIKDHTIRFLVRCFTALGFSIYQHSAIPKPETYILTVLGCSVMAAIFWIVFDYYLNIRRGLELFYLGKTAFLDRMFKEPILQLMAKLFVLAVSLASYYSMVQI